MRYCANCRTPLHGAFCVQCGTSADAPIPEKPTFGSGIPGASFTEYQAAALCYLGWFLTGAYFLYKEPYSKNKVVRYHAQQSILLAAAFMVAMMTVGVTVPFEIRTKAFFVMQFVGMAIWITMMLLTWMKINVELPVINHLAKKNM
jgi:uncharacterized membrane protein